MAFDSLSLIGDERDDFRISYLASIITNLAIGIHGKKGSQIKEVKDFLFDWDVTKPKINGTQSTEEILQIFGGIGERNVKADKSKVNNRNRPPKSLQK